MLRFVFTHPRILAFGVLLTLFSSFGQTFLISIFVPRILDAFSIGTGVFGTLYAAATLTSALSLPYFGRMIDRMPLARFSMAAGAGLVLACFTMALSANLPMLFLAIVGLRLTGQGLLSLTASTTMARVFEQGRGKALSVSSLGYPLGEGLLPLLVVLLVHATGWRASWAILGGVILCVLLPSMYSLIGRYQPTVRAGATGAAVSRTRPRLFRDPNFFLILPGNLYLPVVLTALFLYQVPLAESRGWAVATMASAFIGFAVARAGVSLAIGPLIDRWSAMRIFPVVLVPAALGLLALGLHDEPWVAFAYLILVGFSQGMAGPVMTAVWAEVYGVESLGATKGTVATLGVIGTALGPLLLGGVLAAGVSFETVIALCLLGACGCIATTAVASRRLLKAAAK